jgi:broad specificity phosphatase PhoE
MKPLTLYLLRHGESELNYQRVFAGPSVDPALTAVGAEQAAQQARAWKRRPFSAIYSSPLLRARQTAQIMGEGRQLEILIREQLREVDIGELDGQSIDLPENLATYRSVIARWEQEQKAAGFPDGERLLEVEERARAFLKSIPEMETEGPILVAGHGILFMTVLWLFVKERSERIQDYYMGRCHLTIVRWDGEHFELEKFNIPPQSGVKTESALQ